MFVRWVFFYQISNVNIAVAMKPKWYRWRQIWKREFSAEVTNQNAWDKVAAELCIDPCFGMIFISQEYNFTLYNSIVFVYIFVLYFSVLIYLCMHGLLHTGLQLQVYAHLCLYYHAKLGSNMLSSNTQIPNTLIEITL